MQQRRRGIRTVAGALALMVSAGITGCNTGPGRTFDPAALRQAPVAIPLLEQFETRSALDRWLALSGRWRVRDGVLQQTSRKLTTQPGNIHPLLLQGSFPMRDVDLSVDLRIMDKPRARPRQRWHKPRTDRTAGLIFRFQNPYNYYAVQVVRVAEYTDAFYLYKMVNGERRTRLGERQITVNPEQWFRVRVVAQGNRITGFLDGQEMFSLTDNDLAEGSVGLFTRQAAAEFDDFEIHPLAHGS